ncbi:disease resistance protein RPM1-like [Humulus lupulus]|uniref:disease resistance protein RPM1-like n=1 Tax=Humulus lupulus TaxID=3486 RepID=UPI002B4176F2|nr:disease resistance protein RPM1-like [Humulus lupulus]
MVISLVGQGGIGKTTLVKKVYDEVKHRFDCHAWITVSQSYDMKIILRNAIKQMGPISECTTSHYDMMIQELITPLRQHLQKKRYVIIFDDVWDANFWEMMKHALSSNNNGSRVIITTRNEVVVPYDFILRLETWSFNMAYELFCKKIFQHEFEGRCPEKLEKLSHEIVQKCQGLPLAIGVIAGLLSRKRKVQFEWQKVLDDINFKLKTNPQLAGIYKILSLSYHVLPYHLKLCLLYFGMFPEDFLIWDFMLYQLWNSEGFVQVREGKSLMEESKGYLNELVERSLVSFEIDGLHKRYKVHDLMHEFITSMSNDLCFSQILSKRKSEFGEYRHRRLSIHGSLPESVVKTMQQCTTIRSILFVNFNDDEHLIINRTFLMALFKKLKLLKVLDFEDALLEYLPKEVGNLFHLRYLNLKGTNIKILPESIGRLHNLQHLNLESTQVYKLPKSIGKLYNLYTLNLMYTLVRELPMEINKLCNLRHILAWTKEELGLNIQEGFRHLENLETLLRVEMPQDVIGFTKEVESLSNLKSLGISKLSKETSSVICMIVKKLNRLRHLLLHTSDVDEILDLELISSSSPPLLLSLSLYGRLNKFPCWISELANLEVLVLSFSKLSENPLKYLKDLPNLMSLRMYDNSYEGEHLHFEEGSFSKLIELHLSHLQELKLIRIDRGTLPVLRKLIIQSCSQLEEVPCGIKDLTMLKRLCIWDMPK